ncbi:MAG: metal-dependent transcriptional regulator [Propionibacteriaceae bacterium]|nr:metal-dependent transcriptional regulator [Propionibacteriaceae bacterium]
MAEDGPQVDALSSVAQDYLKVIWSATEWGDPPITTKALAARLGTTPANVSETLRRLDSQGLVHYEPYRPARLSASGRRLALAMVRRHRLLEAFLAGMVGYSWDEVHDEAERLEHAVSDDFLDRIDALLGFPTHDPHGDPIPAPDGRTPATDDTLRLPDAPPGRYLVVRVSDADSATLARLTAAGFAPGAVVPEAPEGLQSGDLDAVRVTVAPGDPLSPGSRS